MKKRSQSYVTAICLMIFLAAFLNTACSEKKAKRPVEEAAESSWQPDPGIAWPALALLKTGANPLWFELGEGGPALIDSPSAASLNPYLPWPHAGFIVGMQFWNGFLVMAVNRDGFIVLGRGKDPEDAALYRVSGRSLWMNYTAESFFLWENKPAVLLYRNDFFSESAAPVLRPQVYTIDLHSPVPLGSSIPGLEIFPASDAPEWESELLRRGSDGFWYYRMKEKGKVNAYTAYFRSNDLKSAGDKISIGEWRSSSRPENPEHIPEYFSAVLVKLSEFGLSSVSAVKTVSPDFEEERIFALSAAAAGVSPNGNESPALLYGFCESSGATANVFVIAPDGRGLYSAGNKPGVFSLHLPFLPEGFVYTGIAALGEVLVASWEEQQEAGIGAAGFMAMNIGMFLR